MLNDLKIEGGEITLREGLTAVFAVALVMGGREFTASSSQVIERAKSLADSLIQEPK